MKGDNNLQTKALMLLCKRTTNLIYILSTIQHKRVDKHHVSATRWQCQLWRKAIAGLSSYHGLLKPVGGPYNMSERISAWCISNGAVDDAVTTFEDRLLAASDEDFRLLLLVSNSRGTRVTKRAGICR